MECSRPGYLSTYLGSVEPRSPPRTRSSATTSYARQLVLYLGDFQCQGHQAELANKVDPGLSHSNRPVPTF